jgi:N-acetylmuramoyl-L-alanine amidase-like protein
VSGLLIAGRMIPVPGVTVIPPAPIGPSWAMLDPRDFRPRSTSWVRQIILHTTGGHWPQPILRNPGPGGHARQIAEMWSGRDRGGGDQIHSAAQIIVDFDGTVVCLCDLADVAAYHAEGSNDWSVGIEMSTTPGGGLYQATIDATVEILPVLCYELGIPFQIHWRPYTGAPLSRMELNMAGVRHQLGGPDCVGIFGHRDNTSTRGGGDPGDAIYVALISAGAEPLDYAAGEDLKVGAARQAWLVQHGAQITIDGKVGPVSLAAARRLGYRHWCLVPTS